MQKPAASVCVAVLVTLFAMAFLPSCGANGGRPPAVEYPPGGSYTIEYGTIYVPAGYTSRKQYPLLVLLHGMSGHHLQFFNGYPWAHEADTREYLVLSLRCSSTSWHHQEWSGPKDLTDVRNVKKGIDCMRQLFSVRDDKIALFGFSAGSHFANVMLLYNKRPFGGNKTFTAFIAVSGGSVHEWTPYLEKRKKVPDSYAVPGLYIWGQREAALPGREMYRLLHENGWPVKRMVHSGGHFIPEGGITYALDWLDDTIP